MGNIREKEDLPWDPPAAKVKIGGRKLWIFGARPEKRRQIVAMLHSFTPAMRRSVASIAILGKHRQDHFGYHDVGQTQLILAHCHGSDGHICIRRGRETLPILAHEVAHALTHQLQENPNNDDYFPKLWTEAAEERYQKNRFSPDHPFPCCGFLDEYGSTRFTEDIAMYVEYIYAAMLNLPHPLHNIPKTDHRYYKKLELLLRYKFISQEDFDFARPFFR